MSLGYTPAAGDSFVLVDNGGTDPISPTLAGLPEGGVLEIGGQVFTISYTGGDGNDVVLTRGVPAGVVAWDGGPTGMGSDWLVPENWSNDVLPTASDKVMIGPAMGDQPTDVSLSGDAAVLTATVGRNLRLTDGALTIGPAVSTFSDLVLDGGSLTPLDGATIGGSVIDGPGTLSNPAGFTLTLTDTTINAPLVNGGTLVVMGPVDLEGGLTTATGSTLQLPAGAGASVDGDVINRGAVDFTSSDTDSSNLWVNGLFTNLGTISVNGVGAAGINATVNNQGVVTVAPGLYFGWGGADLSVNSGTISVGAGDDLRPKRVVDERRRHHRRRRRRRLFDGVERYIHDSGRRSHRRRRGESVVGNRKHRRRLLARRGQVGPVVQHARPGEPVHRGGRSYVKLGPVAREYPAD